MFFLKNALSSAGIRKQLARQIWQANNHTTTRTDTGRDFLTRMPASGRYPRGFAGAAWRRSFIEW